MLIVLLQFLSDFSVDHPLWTSILTVFLTAKVCKWFHRRNRKSPPGPLGLPIVGYLPFLRHNAHQEISKWQQTYGGVFSLNVGSRNVVVLGDYKYVKEAGQNEALSGNTRGLRKMTDRVKHLAGMNPKERKESFAFVKESLSTLSLGVNKLENFVTEEITKLLDKLDGCTGRTEIHMHSLIRPAINHITAFLVLGLNPRKSPELALALEEFQRLSTARFNALALGFALPLLKPVLRQLNPDLPEVNKNIKELTRLVAKEIEAHEKTFDPSSLENYTDYFLDKMKKITGDPFTFTKGVLTGNSLLMLSVGVDSTTSAIEWVLLMMAQHQDIQERVYQEIVETWGQTTWPDWKDMTPMPYLEAVIMETARFKTVTPLGTPHRTLMDTRVGNYDISKDTLIINNFQAVHMDPELWDEPEVFNPDRFLSSDKKTAQAPEFLMPFGSGNRQCPGEDFAKMEVVTIVAAILQHFKVLPPCSGLNTDEDLRALVLRPAFAYIKVQARKDS